MKLKSFGCSMIFGSEIADTNQGRTYSKSTWPALLARHLNLPYECYAYPGLGNLFITQKVLDQATDPEPAVFVVNWSYIDRFDYVICQNRPNASMVQADTRDSSWEALRPDYADKNVVANTYYKHLHSQYRDKLTTLTNIRLCIDVLKEKNLPFIMTFQDQLIWETEWHTTPAVIALQDYIRPHLHSFEGGSMDGYCVARGSSQGPDGHPLEDGHRMCFDYALSNFGIDKIQSIISILFKGV